MTEKVRELLARMDRDMEQIHRESAARKRIEPLVRQMREVYYRFPGATRLHVSEEIYDRLLDYLQESNSSSMVGDIRVMGCPVKKIPDLDGFRWVHEREYCGECGPVVQPETPAS